MPTELEKQLAALATRMANELVQGLRAALAAEVQREQAGQAPGASTKPEAAPRAKAQRRRTTAKRGTSTKRPKPRAK